MKLFSFAVSARAAGEHQGCPDDGRRGRLPAAAAVASTVGDDGCDDAGKRKAAPNSITFIKP